MHHDIYEFKLRQFHGNPNSCKSYFDSCRKYINNVEFTERFSIMGYILKLSVAGIQ